MKRFILFSFGFIAFLYFFSGNAYAQIPPMLGVDCGNPQSSTPSTSNRCCYFDATSGQPTLPSGNIIDTFRSFVSGLIDAPLKGIADTKRKIQVPACVNGAVPTLPGDPANPSCICVPDSKSPLVAIEKMCNDIGEQNKPSSERGECLDCVLGRNGTVGVWTALGCFSTDIPTLIQGTRTRTGLLGWGVGFAGILSLLCMIYSAILMQTSRGNPERIKKAQELLVSCITGLLLIIFSIFILRFIGVDILRIPGFG